MNKFWSVVLAAILVLGATQAVAEDNPPSASEDTLHRQLLEIEVERAKIQRECERLELQRQEVTNRMVQEWLEEERRRRSGEQKQP